MNTVESAVSLFEQGFSCSQAVLAAFAPGLGLEREMALKVAGVFGGGMGRMAETCGAVTGALMVIGLECGATQAEDKQTKEKAYDLVSEFVDRFQSRHGSIVCRELLGRDISIPGQVELAWQEGLFTTHCPGFVRDAAEIIEQMLK